MAVYKKTYRPYQGELTSSLSRIFVIPRYAFEDMQRSRFLTIFYILTMLPALISAIIIYVQHFSSALGLVGAQNASRLISINVVFFMTLLSWECMLALFLAAFIGPGQISPDLANNALSLYLARPFSRVEYVIGKMSVLVLLLSMMTWVPGLLVFSLEGYLEGWDWVKDHLRYASGIFFGAWIWILVLSLLALALSAWVKWKPAAGGLMFGVFFVGLGFGSAVNAIQRTNWGNLFNIRYLIGSVWVQLFEGTSQTTNGAVFFRAPLGEELPMWCSWTALAGLAGICLYMLARKIRGAEVVR